MLNSHVYFLNKAILLSEQVPKKMKYRHGAILVKNGEIISVGYNRLSLSSNSKIRDISKRYNIQLVFKEISTIHAEVSCFSSLNMRQDLIRNSTLYVYGESKCGNIVKSRPCCKCMKLCVFLGIKDVVYCTRSTKSSYRWSFEVERLR